jgi:hypothetical protein
MSRYKAFLLHLCFSAIVLFIIFLLIQQIWYPGKLFTLAAGYNLLRLIVCVDLVIGPLIMLIIFDAKKKLIKMDVAIILICQLTFMLYGLWTMFSARPAFYVFAEKHFYLVRANEISSKDLLASKYPQFNSLPLWGPVYIGTAEPDDINLRNDLAFGSLGGAGIQNLPKYFVPYEQVIQQVKEAGKTSQQLGVDFETKARVKEYEKNHTSKPILFLPMVNKRTPLIVAIDPASAKIIDLI